jgi:hypothetical protein
MAVISLDGTKVNDFADIPLQRGNTYTLTSGLKFAGKNQKFYAVGSTSLPKPIIQLLGGSFTGPLQPGAGNDGLTVDGIRFVLPSLAYAIWGEGNNLTLRNCETLGGGLLETKGPSSGTNLVEKCQQISRSGEYWMFFSGVTGGNHNWTFRHLHAMQGCGLHTVRGYGVYNFLFDDVVLMNLGNTTYQAAKLHDGDGVTVQNCGWFGDQAAEAVKFGPLRTSENGAPGRTLKNLRVIGSSFKRGSVTFEAGTTFVVEDLCASASKSGGCFSFRDADPGSPGSLPAQGTMTRVNATYADSTGRFAFGLRPGITVTNSLFAKPSPFTSFQYP